MYIDCLGDCCNPLSHQSDGALFRATERFAVTLSSSQSRGAPSGVYPDMFHESSKRMLVASTRNGGVVKKELCNEHGKQWKTRDKS